MVPFCPESELSGVGNRDFLNAVWYRREVTIPEAWAGGRVLLHFQAVDYDTTVWVNGIEVGRHGGGFSPFSCDLQGAASPCETVTIVVRARDSHTQSQPRGKQVIKFAPHGAIYVHTTGIWQTVWMESIPDTALRRPRITLDVANGLIRLEQPLTAVRTGMKLRVTLSDEQGEITVAEIPADSDFAPHLDVITAQMKSTRLPPPPSHRQ